MRFGVRSVCILVAGFAMACTQPGYELRVQHMADPEYPRIALISNVQGTVHVMVLIGADGKVQSASSGSHGPLEEAAETNVRQWQFGPFPADCEFPIHHIVTYVFKLQAPALSVIEVPALVHTYLPDRVEITSHLFKDDYGFKRTEPAPATKPPGAAK